MHANVIAMAGVRGNLSVSPFRAKRGFFWVCFAWARNFDFEEFTLSKAKVLALATFFSFTTTLITS